MPDKLPARMRWWWAAALAATLVFLHSLLAGGVTWDEEVHFAGTRQQIKFALGVLTGTGSRDFETIPLDWSFYGIGILLPAHALAYVVDTLLLGRPLTYHQSFSIFAHILAFGSGLLASWLAGRLVALATGDDDLATGAAIALLALPPWLGQTFFNYKDVPVAAGVIAAVYCAALYLRRGEPRALTGFFLALLFLGSQKLAALPLALPAAALVTLAVARDPSRVRVASLVGHAAAFLVLLYLVTPPAWVEPMRFVSRNLAYMAQHAWDGCTLTAGECMGRGSAAKPSLYSPLRYLGLWYAVQLPLAWLALIAVAAALYLHRSGDAVRHLIAASIAWPLLVIVWSQSTLYDGIRHTLFLLPLAAAFMFICVPTELWRRMRRWLVGYAVFLGIEIVALQPYAFTWFNEAARFRVDHTSYATDYWGYSLGEASRRARPLRRPGEPLIGAPRQSVAPFFPGIEVAADDAGLVSGSRYLAVWVPRNGALPPSNCETLSTVRRWQLLAPRLITLSYVTRCTKP